MHHISYRWLLSVIESSVEYTSDGHMQEKIPTAQYPWVHACAELVMYFNLEDRSRPPKPTQIISSLSLSVRNAKGCVELNMELKDHFVFAEMST